MNRYVVVVFGSGGSNGSNGSIGCIGSSGSDDRGSSVGGVVDSDIIKHVFNVGSWMIVCVRVHVCIGVA